MIQSADYDQKVLMEVIFNIEIYFCMMEGRSMARIRLEFKTSDVNRTKTWVTTSLPASFG